MKIKTQNTAADLQNKFPAIKSALALVDEKNAGSPSASDLRVTVERVDLDLLSNTPVHLSGKRASLRHPEHADLLGWQHEVFFAVNSKHEILGQIGCPTPSEERDQTPVKHLVMNHCSELSYLVRVNVIGWCKRVTDWISKGGPLGELDRREITVTVYREPDEGFAELLDRTWTDQNLRMHFVSARMGMSFDENPDVWYLLKRLYPMVQEFEKRSFFKGFKDSLPPNAGNHKGKVGDVEFVARTWGDGSKIDVRFEKNDVMIGFFWSGNNGSYHNFGNLSVDALDATLEEARQLLEEVNLGWERSLIGEETLKRLNDLWTAAAEVISFNYAVKLTVLPADFQKAVPGVRFISWEEDKYLIEVPTESDDAFQLALKNGLCTELTIEDARHLQQLDRKRNESMRQYGERRHYLDDGSYIKGL